MTAKVLAGTPCYGGVVTVPYMKSFMTMQQGMAEQGIGLDLITLENESLITRARNGIANFFLRETDHSHLLFIDADLGFEPDVLPRYLEADRDVICGIYPAKIFYPDRLRGIPAAVPDAQAQAAALNYTAKPKPGFPVDSFGLFRAEYGATGFMLIKREVLVKLRAAYPALVYRKSHVAAGDEGFDNIAFFDTMIDPETLDYLPEDYAFCKRWTAIGGEVYADALSKFRHVGSHTFVGDYPAYLTHNQPKR